MKLHRLRPFLLLAAVLLGQWLGIAHASQHQALEPDNALCSYCVSGLATGAAPAADLPSLDLAHPQAAPDTALASFTPAIAGGLPRNRGPPQHF